LPGAVLAVGARGEVTNCFFILHIHVDAAFIRKFTYTSGRRSAGQRPPVGIINALYRETS
jgi:hypothetical protein